MKGKSMFFTAGILMFVFTLFAFYQLALAAPAGELTMVSPMIGNEIPVPWMEQAHSNDWMKLLYDPLVGTTSDAKRSTEAGLAEKWEMSPDGLIWTFYIRKGVKFHDGTELTAKDAKFSIEKAMAPDSRAHNAGNLRHAIKSMELKDTYTLVVYCKSPSSFLPDGLFSDIGGPGGSVLPKDYYERVGYDKFVKNPIGTGPYKFHSQIQGSFIKLEATDKHWRDGTPRYKYVTFRIIQEDGTRIAMLKTGEADISRIGRESVKDLQNAGLNVISKRNAAIVMFQFNIIWESPAFSDVRFRKAINLAIDREAIIKHIFGNMASPTATYPGANIFGVGGVPNLTPYPYAPEEARKLIKEGRYEGYEFPVPNYSRPGCPELSRVVEASCGYWEKIGVKPKIFNIEYPKYGEMRRTRKTSGHLSPHDSMTCSALPELMQLFRENLHSAAPRTNAKDPKVDQMIERAEKSLDRIEVEKLLVDLYRYSYDNYVFVPICDIHDEIAVNKRVPKWEPGDRRADRNLNDIIRQR
jgi:peptide/nickel transport system substrate-binding protein